MKLETSGCDVARPRYGGVSKACPIPVCLYYLCLLIRPTCGFTLSFPALSVAILIIDRNGV